MPDITLADGLPVWEGASKSPRPGPRMTHNGRTPIDAARSMAPKEKT